MNISSISRYFDKSGRIQVPKEFLNELEIGPKMLVDVLMKDNEIIIKKITVSGKPIRAKRKLHVRPIRLRYQK